MRRRSFRLSDIQAIVLALFMYGVARSPEDVSHALRLPVDDAFEICAELDEAGLIDLSES